MRHALDAYFTPPWQTRALLRRVHISGSVLEPCCGDFSLLRQIEQSSEVHWTCSNDIDPKWKTTFCLDATKTESWAEFPRMDWVVTNPPFNLAIEILPHALLHAKIGVVFLGRLSFLEPTKERSEFLCANPPDRQIVLPRWSYKGNGKSDSVTTAWMIWDKNFKADVPIQIVPLSEKTEAMATACREAMG